MPSSKGPTDNRREAAKARMAQAIRDGDDATVTAMIREANPVAPSRQSEGLRRLYQCPGCWSWGMWPAPTGEFGSFECECGERLTRIDLREDPS